MGYTLVHVHVHLLSNPLPQTISYQGILLHVHVSMLEGMERGWGDYMYLQQLNGTDFHSDSDLISSGSLYEFV